MRDEIKAAIFCSIVASLCIGVFVVYHPAHWRAGAQSVLPPSRHFSDAPPPEGFEQFIARYGPPTREEQSPTGPLHPALFTKWLDYEPEHVRVAFIASAGTETPLSPTWLAISFVDALGTWPISADEAGRRLMSRQKSVEPPSVPSR